MSKKRREKVKAKQRRHSDGVAPKSVPAASLEPASKQGPLRSTKPMSKPQQTLSPKAQPQIILNSNIEHAAPAWKAFYSAVSETASRS